MLTNIGIPYMGSKRRLAHEIINFITKRHPDATEFYDLFGGGGSMSFAALQMPQFTKVVYNEFNTQIVELIRYCQKLPTDKSLYKLGQIYPDKFYEWVSHNDFDKYKNQQDYYGGMICTCWSFGNTGKSYMFGKDVEETKRLAHMVCVYKDEDCLKKLNDLGIKISSKILDLKTIYGRRMFIKDYVARNKKVSDLEQLQQLEQLERLQQLQQLEQLQTFNLDYKNFDISKISENAIVYLDPPYENTSDYKNNVIDYKHLYEWVKSIKAHVYLSSYESPMKCVRVLKHNSTLAGAKNQSKVFEKIFYNEFSK